MNIGLGLRLGAIILTSVTCFTTSAFAVDGVVLIDQARALAGNVTPGDAPGFPVTISVPGSFRLSGNLTVTAGADGIDLAANNVTLDLNGFQIVGANGEKIGVRNALGGQHGVAIRNGSVSNFAIGVGLGSATGSEVTQIRAIGNTVLGIVAGVNAIVTGNTAARNDIGIVAGVGSIVTGNNVFENERVGLEVSAFGAALNNLANQNGIGVKVTCPVNVVANTSLRNDLNFVADDDDCSLANNHFPPNP